MSLGFNAPYNQVTFVRSSVRPSFHITITLVVVIIHSPPSNLIRSPITIKKPKQIYLFTLLRLLLPSMDDYSELCYNFPILSLLHDITFR